MDHLVTIDLGEVAANWKLLMENFIEPYHVQFVHATTTEQPLADHYTVNDPGCLGCAVDVSGEANKIAMDTGDVEATDTNALPQWTFNWVGIGFHPDDDKFREEFNAGMEGYIGSEQMLADVAQYDYIPGNVPGDVATDWICANR